MEEQILSDETITEVSKLIMKSLSEKEQIQARPKPKPFLIGNCSTSAAKSLGFNFCFKLSSDMLL